MVDWVSLKAGLSNFLIKMLELVEKADGTGQFVLEAVVQTGSTTKDKEYVPQTTSLLLLGDKQRDQH